MKIKSKSQKKDSLDFLKKIGSNFYLQNQRICFDPRSAWQIVVKSGFVKQSDKVAKKKGKI